MMQARWGSHGDYEIIALTPNSPQECFDLTIQAFNLAEQYRVPVLVMMDECVGHMTERVVIPPADQIELVERRTPHDVVGAKADYPIYRPAADLVPPMPPLGEGYRFHVTGLTHDERGYPVMTAEAQERLVRRLVEKIRTHADEITIAEEYQCRDAQILVVAYGITSRVVQRSVELAREKGIRVGLFRPVVVWPFAERRLRQLAEQVEAVVVVEMNYGQIVHEVERIVGGRAPVALVPHGGGALHDPLQVLAVIDELHQ
jgi:Pyruvate:ferredoxin oxidoreductase and related 2-oxoacid:ferredoxin oxidoreductases, alpha subunit